MQKVRVLFKTRHIFPRINGPILSCDLRMLRERCKILDKNCKCKFQPLSLVRQNLNNLSSFMLNTIVYLKGRNVAVGKE